MQNCDDSQLHAIVLLHLAIAPFAHLCANRYVNTNCGETFLMVLFVSVHMRLMLQIIIIESHTMGTLCVRAVDIASDDAQVDC